MSNAAEPQSPDHLNRGAFLAALESNIEVLAKVPSDRLATPRVIAIDAQWGDGKTWIATELARRLRGPDGTRPVVSIDVFRYDHHDDPFAVIAAAIYEALKPNSAVKKKFLEAAGAVLKSAAPVAAKAGITLGARAIGLSADDTDELAKGAVGALKESVGSFSEKAVEKLFASYSATERIQKNFMQMLSDLTKELEHPLVVLVDELDRCRPSFALEVLERIKHLFGAENVVFVLFWNSRSIHESIRHTYGPGTDATNYLAKFVAFSIPLELETPRGTTLGRRFLTFVRAMGELHFTNKVMSHDFCDAMIEASGILNPSLRQIQQAIQLTEQLKVLEAEGEPWPTVSAYLLLLRTIDRERFERIISLDAQTARLEAALIASAFKSAPRQDLSQLHVIFTYIADRERLDNLAKDIRTRTFDVSTLTDEERHLMQETDMGKWIPMFQQHAKSIFEPLTFS